MADSSATASPAQSGFVASCRRHRQSTAAAVSGHAQFRSRLAGNHDAGGASATIATGGSRGQACVERSSESGATVSAALAGNRTAPRQRRRWWHHSRAGTHSTRPRTLHRACPQLHCRRHHGCTGKCADRTMFSRRAAYLYGRRNNLFLQRLGAEAETDGSDLPGNGGCGRNHARSGQGEPGIQVPHLFRRRHWRRNHLHGLRSGEVKRGHLALRRSGAGRNYAGIEGWCGPQLFGDLGSRRHRQCCQRRGTQGRSHSFRRRGPGERLQGQQVGDGRVRNREIQLGSIGDSFTHRAAARDPDGLGRVVGFAPTSPAGTSRLRAA